MSVMTKKPEASNGSGLRNQAAFVVRQVGPMTQQAKPLAMNAGTSLRQGRDNAVAWATPMVESARTWAAPQIEQSARIVSETLAPMISSALISAAHKIEVTPPKRRGRKSLILGTMLLTIAAGLAALLVARRNDIMTFSSSAPSTEPADVGPVNTADSMEARPSSQDDGDDPGAGMDGSRIV